MHSFLYRANALLTFAGTTLAAMCILATISDGYHKQNITADVKLARVERLQGMESGNDEAYLAFEINADLRSLFSWNTKQLFVFLAAEYTAENNKLNQVSLWDRIIENQEDAVLNLPYVRNKYKLIDQGHNLRGRELNLTLFWNIMPFTGRLQWGHQTFPNITLPEEYSRADPHMPNWRAEMQRMAASGQH
mmetsp:Transcript_37057/g.44799  ORF Transcript_37057/g.44799 Transcript_37057/m.44799 type:complete len:191 (-) Transcript_37057:499-1071(-)|eukprot:CAMPEP_0197862570 /NCGR_PEP_ID=MMETSP1438-20131217/39444_1 /TAXON_ID=1461541 /ORGANISM="Pterosperma sp., Strain CCMP1384" /LENGTH=190 /DNA_ID=CAMNT_0043480173 /DNA_START=119 /DNA_END=691 /DNA_ORIENTATION=+